MSADEEKVPGSLFWLDYALAGGHSILLSDAVGEEEFQERLVGHGLLVGQCLELDEQHFRYSARNNLVTPPSGSNDFVETLDNLSHLFRCGFPQLCANPLYCERPDLADFHP